MRSLSALPAALSACLLLSAAPVAPAFAASPTAPITITADDVSDDGVYGDVVHEVDASADPVEADYSDVEPLDERPFYIALRGAYTVAADDARRGDNVSGSGALGLDLESTFNVPLTRFEAEVGFLSASGRESGATLALFSLYRDVAEFFSLKPYVGAGVGFVVSSQSKSRGQNTEQTGFAWHLTGGVSLEWSDDALIDVGYRYLEVGDGARGIGDGTSGARHDVFAGVRFKL
ncbi:MAG: hypothetical protein AAGJ70_08060 [Pseudomonadota bacterium]